MSIVLDYKGLSCPIPLVKTNKEIAKCGADTYVVSVDNEIAVENFKKMAKDKGYEISTKKISDENYEVTIIVSEASLAKVDAKEEINCTPVSGGNNMVAVFGSNVMGDGDEKLGSSLLKGFIFAISQLETLPTTMLFYNKGANLTCEGSASLEDLKKLEELGVKIKTCGTCLDFYGIKDKLSVGEVTNMYDIVETQVKADKILRPW